MPINPTFYGYVDSQPAKYGIHWCAYSKQARVFVEGITLARDLTYLRDAQAAIAFLERPLLQKRHIQEQNFMLMRLKKLEAALKDLQRVNVDLEGRVATLEASSNLRREQSKYMLLGAGEMPLYEQIKQLDREAAMDGFLAGIEWRKARLHHDD